MKLTKSLTLNTTTLLEQLALVFAESETGPTMNAHEFINYDVESTLSNPYVPIEDEIIDMLDAKDDATNY